MAIQLQGDSTSTVSSDLSVGGDFNVVGTSDLQGNVTAYGSLATTGSINIGGNSTFTGLTTHARGVRVTGSTTSSGADDASVYPLIHSGDRDAPNLSLIHI